MVSVTAAERWDTGLQDAKRLPTAPCVVWPISRPTTVWAVLPARRSSPEAKLVRRPSPPISEQAAEGEGTGDPYGPEGSMRGRAQEAIEEGGAGKACNGGTAGGRNINGGGIKWLPVVSFR